MSRMFRSELDEIRRWLRDAERFRARLEEAVARERMLERMPDSAALRRAKRQQQAASRRWAAEWAERAEAIDRIPNGVEAAVLGYRYLQGHDMGRVSVIMGCNIKSVYRFEARGVEWLLAHMDIKKEPQ